jgi:hypothetical protein
MGVKGPVAGCTVQVAGTFSINTHVFVDSSQNSSNEQSFEVSQALPRGRHEP